MKVDHQQGDNHVLLVKHIEGPVWNTIYQRGNFKPLYQSSNQWEKDICAADDMGIYNVGPKTIAKLLQKTPISLLFVALRIQDD